MSKKNDKEPRDDGDDNRSGGTQKKRQSNLSGKNNKTSNHFKGEKSGMIGKVFCLQSEHSKKDEFKDTLEALERYPGRNYPLDTAMLQTLFKQLKTPSIDEPKLPEQSKTIKAEEGMQEISEWDKIKYTENFRPYLKNQERLTSTLIALYNVALGQCSKKLQDRLKAETGFDEVSKLSDIANQ